MSRTTSWAATAAAALLASAAHAQDYFDFGRIPGVSGDPTVQIDLNPAMLALFGGAVGAPSATDSLAGIEGVRVYVYEAIEDAGAVRDFIDNTSERLERDGWSRTVFVQDEDARVRIYSRVENSRISGLTLMVVDTTEAVFINVAGQINPQQLAQLMNGVGVGGALGGFDFDSERERDDSP